MSTFAELAAMRIQLSDQALAQPVQDETVLLDLKSAQYFGLNEVGGRVWALLAEGLDLTAVRDQLLDEFDVTLDVLEPDLVGLLQALVAEGLVTVSAERKASEMP